MDPDLLQPEVQIVQLPRLSIIVVPKKFPNTIQIPLKVANNVDSQLIDANGGRHQRFIHYDSGKNLISVPKPFNFDTLTYSLTAPSIAQTEMPLYVVFQHQQAFASDSSEFIVLNENITHATIFKCYDSRCLNLSDDMISAQSDLPNNALYFSAELKALVIERANLQAAFYYVAAMDDFSKVYFSTVNIGGTEKYQIKYDPTNALIFLGVLLAMLIAYWVANRVMKGTRAGV